MPKEDIDMTTEAPEAIETTDDSSDPATTVEEISEVSTSTADSGDSGSEELATNDADAGEGVADAGEGVAADSVGSASIAGLTNEWTGPAPEGSPEVLDEDTLLAEDGESEEPYVSPFDRPGKWFVVHTQSGYEKKVKRNIEARTESMNMEHRIYEVEIPTREVTELKNLKKVVTEKKLFPGYLLVRCRLDDDAWYVLRNTPGVTGFVNQGGKPSPLRRKDVETFLGIEADRQRAAAKKSKPMFEYGLTETVRVVEGPFADFLGEIIEINEDQLKVKVLLNIFGRETPVELEFAQVARL